MKIIKMGNLSVATNTCPYCNCEYEYNESDIYTGYELTIQYAYVICPCCGQINKINTLPPHKYYPPISPIVTFQGYTYSDASSHIPTIEGFEQHSTTKESHDYWSPSLKAEEDDGDGYE